MMILGGAIAALSGAILVGFINLWAPGAWAYERYRALCGNHRRWSGNHRGAILGALLVPLGFEEATRFLPPLSNPTLVPALEWVAVGALIVLFLWFRPSGILPERRRFLSGAGPGSIAVASIGESDALINLGNLDQINFRELLHFDDVPKAGGIILSTNCLSRSFNGVTVVSDVSISIERGRLTGLIGPNGAGKSTTLAMLAGTLSPSSGSVFLEDVDIKKMPSRLRANAGIVRTFQLASEFKKAHRPRESRLRSTPPIGRLAVRRVARTTLLGTR